MPLKMKSILPPEINTNVDTEKQQQHPAGGRAFRDAETPKHRNRGDKNGNASNAPPYQHPAYPHYPASGPPGPPGPPGSHGPPGSFYGVPHGSVHPQMMPPGGPGYNNYQYGGYYPPHPNHGPGRPPYPPYGNQPMPYNPANYPSYGDAHGRHPLYNAHTSHQNHTNASMDFTRAVSSSFSESNTKSKPSSFQSDQTRDDLSIGADSDASWKHGLNQVASIEEEKFEARNGATTPVERICPTLSSDLSSSPAGGFPKGKKPALTPSKTAELRKLSSIASMQEPIDTSSVKNELDLKLCSTGSSGLLFGDDGSTSNSTSKRFREGHDNEDRMRYPSPPTPSTMHFNNLSVKEERDAPPSKRNRTSIGEERDLYTSFSMDSMGSLGKTGGKLPEFGKATSKPSSQSSGFQQSSSSEREECEQEFSHNMPSWDITGQDSFGGGFSVASNLNEGNPDTVLGKSFSFSHEDELGPNGDDNSKGINSKRNPETMEKLETIASMNPSESINLSRVRNSSHEGNYPPNSSTWITNSSSQGGSFSVDSPGPPPHGSQHLPPPPHGGRYGNMPPPYHDGHRHMYRPPGSYGMHRRPQPFLPPTFQPPASGMSGPPMSRNAPPPVYMMPNPHRGPSGMSRMGMKPGSKVNHGTLNWSKNDDARLQDILKKFKNPKDWKAIAKELNIGKSAKECNERWIRYLKPGVRKGQWQDHEDAIVIEAVTTCKEQPFTRWSDLAQKLPGRVGKQIRDRWVNHLNPNINHMPFTKEDDMKLWEGHKQLGKRWVEISTKLFNSSRSENHIKNRWYSASFKKFVATEFGPDAYVPCDKKGSKRGSKSKSPAKK